MKAVHRKVANMDGNNHRYVLVFSPDGIVGSPGSEVRVFDYHSEAHDAMCWHLESCIIDWKEYGDDYDDHLVSENHASMDVSTGNGAEWHIYEI